MLRTREKRFPVQSGVVGVTLAKRVSEILAVCVAVAENNNVTKDCLFAISARLRPQT
jgi:hypothetical protein